MESTPVVLCGLGSWLPPIVVDNSGFVSPQTAAFIRRRMGIAQRHRVTPGTATVHLAVQAGRRALASSGLDSAEALILATSTPERLCPAGAPEVATELGMTGIPAFDVSAGCSGFLYACEIARGLLSARTVRSVLIVAAEIMSAFVNQADPQTAPLFGDGAGAAVLRAAEPTEKSTFGPAVWGSDGTLSDILAIPAGGSRQRVPVDGGGELFLRMKGSHVLRNAVRRMSESVREAIASAGWDLRDVDVLLTHQANAAISHAVAAALDFPTAKMPSNIATVGNTAAASLPLLLTHAVADGTLNAGHRAVLVAFGSGLSWAATTAVWPSGLSPHM
ncbi:beta-ketoacyl-ACP synthase 3 [Amycolatopsis sp. PS_44_ISF1]|uniref:3-oxoacyl-ACP synthase III family protein n=1 Tax=Amycolatopsis sp. PS_44_ISF1 TaxID=2974917 RepID=UPI0028DD47EC|nr:beta-ketoacyl-ACP synthase 3 [Amycolatopsis sp. PS_44_ISF1]MDT8913701.1 beta-ketoacyl-ACP synthase 3 [Amycolatopsis sp. PS_44_ISF1]